VTGVVELPTSLRSELKGAMGPVFTDPEGLLADAGTPLVAVGDMVTYHLLEAGRVPDVALVDEHTERTEVETEVWDAIGGFDREVTVSNQPAVLTAELLTALREALDRADGTSTLIIVDGEEDLASLPALVAAPTGASVVYGQPGEGMVLVDVRQATAERARDLLSRMDGDRKRLWSLLSVDD
jgi:uncharacterized protein (UPF0218 family)